MLNQPKTDESRWTILKILKWTTSYFKSLNIGEPRASAEIILAYALKLTRIDLYLRYDQPLDKTELSLFKTLVKRRANHEPVAYIVGSREFWSLDFEVTPDVLIPRPETECLVEAALALLPENRNDPAPCLLELGTGSGAIVISLATERPGCRFFAVDKSIRAVQLARQNAGRHLVDGIIHFCCCSWFEALNSERWLYDIIVSNPPYIPTETVGGLQPDIVAYEPHAALDGGKDGLFSIRHIITHAHRYMICGGWLLLEIGHDQRIDTGRIIDETGAYDQVRYIQDYSGYDRIVQMRKK
ncbi:MAG: peptide chain release factor N(5)-glutamine methyltransferase [Desulfobacterales bacterium]|nr:peptide chain release factor N(5)-glutamine methyltransferase [Desulfobacterales bacterium]MDD4391679.1 peptide chain release factor N(5)-glutamine methyltransferase [Desulfobacterales bacterium]